MSESFNSPDFKKYKFKELKVYASTEWLANNTKKYRQVFDRYTTSYIYAELSFYNKYFDVKGWEVNVRFKCYRLQQVNKEICNLEFKKKISKYDNVVFIREGWGNKKDGAFWKAGTYLWEAYIEEELIATKYFYIEDVGINFENFGNPYFKAKSIKLFEGQFDDIAIENRNYYRAFAAEDTRYIHTEINLENIHKEVDWHCELFIKYYNEARELKGQVNRLMLVNKGTDIIQITGGWGSNTPTSWRKGKYSVEIIFMERMIASVPFEVEDEFEEGIPTPYLPYDDYQLDDATSPATKETFEEVLVHLERLIGLKEVKKKVKEHAQYIKFLTLRKSKGFEEKEQLNIHSVFTGNPGTGKTTVASMMGKLYHKMGLLTKGHVHEVDRVDLVGEYIGQTAPKVKEAIDRARGGVLFIDEAYSLARSNDDSKDFGREVIEILVKEMSNPSCDFAVIVAGYPTEMKNFINSNPGLKSRFKHFFEFKDYLPQELIQIAQLACKEKALTFEPEAQSVLEEMLVAEYRKRDKTFGNARYVYDLLDKVKVNLGLRIMKRKNPASLSKDVLSLVKHTDIIQLYESESAEIANIPVDDGLLQIAMDELNSLIGIDEIKSQVKDLVEIVRFHRKAGRQVVSNYSFHSVFVGNPGTGKTTVARILANIYKALGVLERGHMVETDRQGLIAGFVGQTAIKTAERIEEAMGGVLFIDEAYALSNFNGLQGDFGNEAIQTILKRMEDNRGKFFVFAAGYPDNMKKFLDANPGLNSRFDKTFVFEDYSADQLCLIAKKMIEDHNLVITPKALAHLSELLHELYRQRDKYFGNARTVRKIILDVIKNQNLRLASDLDNVSTQNQKTITKDDILKLDIFSENKAFVTRGIGYR